LATFAAKVDPNHSSVDARIRLAIRREMRSPNAPGLSQVGNGIPRTGPKVSGAMVVVPADHSSWAIRPADSRRSHQEPGAYRDFGRPFGRQIRGDLSTSGMSAGREKAMPERSTTKGKGQGAGRQIYISWDQQWATQVALEKDGKKYRLLTEAEWEYARGLSGKQISFLGPRPDQFAHCNVDTRPRRKQDDPARMPAV